MYLNDIYVYNKINKNESPKYVRNSRTTGPNWIFIFCVLYCQDKVYSYIPLFSLENIDILMKKITLGSNP